MADACLLHWFVRAKPGEARLPWRESGSVTVSQGASAQGCAVAEGTYVKSWSAACEEGRSVLQEKRVKQYLTGGRVPSSS